jgi:hypothetical protein
VQITVAESIGIENRGAFYEQTGAFRDMVVTHLFQVLGFVAMEPPTSLTARALTDEKVKVFEAMKPVNPARVVRGQYEGYRSEAGVAPDSDVETFVALEVGRRVGQPRVEPHIGRGQVGQSRLSHPSRRQGAEPAIDAADKPRVKLALRWSEWAYAIRLVHFDQAAQLRSGSGQSAACEMQAIRPGELRE